MTNLIKVPNILVREFNQMEWFDPKQVLVNLRFIELNLPTDLDERVRRLRTNQLKEWREARLAALIAYGFGVKVVNAPTFISKTEKMDFDFVMKWQSGSMDTISQCS